MSQPAFRGQDVQTRVPWLKREPHSEQVNVVAPAGAPPCAPGSSTRQVELELAAPLADRAVVVVPPGAAVPSIEPG